MKVREDRLNNHFAQADFKLDEGESLMKEMQLMRDELSQYEDEVSRLIQSSQDIIPLRQRRERLRQPVEAIAICKFQNKEVYVCIIYFKEFSISTNILRIEISHITHNIFLFPFADLYPKGRNLHHS